MGPEGRKCCHVLQRAECLHVAILILNIVFLSVCCLLRQVRDKDVEKYCCTLAVH